MEFSKYRISNYIICILKSEFKVSKQKIVKTFPVSLCNMWYRSKFSFSWSKQWKTFELKLPEVLSLKGWAIIIIIITSGVLFVTNFFVFVGNTSYRLRRGLIQVQEMLQLYLICKVSVVKRLFDLQGQCCQTFI